MMPNSQDGLANVQSQAAHVFFRRRANACDMNQNEMRRKTKNLLTPQHAQINMAFLCLEMCFSSSMRITPKSSNHLTIPSSRAWHILITWVKKYIVTNSVSWSLALISHIRVPHFRKNWRSIAAWKFYTIYLWYTANNKSSFPPQGRSRVRCLAWFLDVPRTNANSAGKLTWDLLKIHGACVLC